MKISKGWDIPTYTITQITKKHSDYCVCIPVKNEGERIRKQLQKMKRLAKQIDIIIIDWGSTDKSLNKTFLRSCNVTTLLTKTSEGKQASQLRIGFSYALENGYKGIIQIDGNNKDGVSAIPNFIKELKNGYDYIQGSRFVKGGKAVNTPLKRLIGIRLIVSPILSAASRFWYTDVTNGFRGYSRNYLLHPEVLPFREVFVSYALNFYLCVRANQLNLKTKEIPVLRAYPKGEVPTQMHSVKSQLDLLYEATKTALGYYHPSKS
jgi:dolichol-phosphate mannosyltransferase